MRDRLPPDALTLSLPLSRIMTRRPGSGYTPHSSPYRTRLSSLQPLHVFFLRPEALFSPSLLPRGLCLLTPARPLMLRFDVLSLSWSPSPDLHQAQEPYLTIRSLCWGSHCTVWEVLLPHLHPFLSSGLAAAWRQGLGLGVHYCHPQEILLK